MAHWIEFFHWRVKRKMPRSVFGYGNLQQTLKKL